MNEILHFNNHKFKFKNTDLFFFIVLLFYLLVAYKSSGYVQEDEHYQIIEFANYKLGLLPIDKLAWEFNAGLRSGLQPLICYVLFKIFGYIGITDGYNLAFLLRAVTAIFSIFVIKRFISAFNYHIAKSLQVYFIFSSYLLWFLPYINVRFSSETWSGLFLLLTLATIEKNREQHRMKQYFIIGAYLACSIILRYQSALFAVGILLWLIIVNKATFKNLLAVATSALLILLLSLFIDLWLYGRFTFSIYNYFYVNLIEGVSSKFGTSPFYEYILYILSAPGPFGVMIFVSFFVLFYKTPKNIIIWAIAPFLFVHSLIPHKELRFLYPLANLSPLLLFLAFQFLYESFGQIKFKLAYTQLVKNGILISLFLINAAGLFGVASTGAGKNRIVVAEYIHRNFDLNNTNVIMSGDVNPYMDWGTVKNSFYSSLGVHTDRITNIWQPDLLEHKKPNQRNILIIYNNDISGPQSLLFMKRIGLSKVYQNIPDLTSTIFNFYSPSLNEARISIYEFK